MPGRDEWSGPYAGGGGIATRNLHTQRSVPSTSGPTWLDRLTTYFKSLSALDTASAGRAIDETGPADADGPLGEQRSSRNSSQRTSRASPRDSAYITKFRLAEERRAKARAARGTTNLAPHGGLMSRLRRYIGAIGGSKPSKPTPALPETNREASACAHHEPAAPQQEPIALQLEIPHSPHSAHAELEEVVAAPSARMPIVTDRDSAHMASPSVWSGPDASLDTPTAPASVPSAATPRKSTIIAMAEHLPPGMARDVWCIEDYADLQQLHSGYASFVMKATCKHSGQAVALKIYQPDLLHQISQYQLMREARLHVQLYHPHVIRLYAAFQQEDGVVLVQEYADGGDLLHYLGCTSGGRLSERRAVRLVVKPLLQALNYLHNNYIIHRDVKLENILFSGPDMCLKLADFGLCLNFREERCVTRAGTLDYMAPEILKCPTKDYPEDNKDREDLAYTCAVDVWSIGILAYELICGVPPFTRRERQETERLIMSGGRPQFMVHVSSLAENFIYSCLERDAHSRPSADELLRAPWMKAGLVASQPPPPDNARSQSQPMPTLTASPAKPNLAAKAPSAGRRQSAADEPTKEQVQQLDGALMLGHLHDDTRGAMFDCLPNSTIISAANYDASLSETLPEAQGSGQSASVAAFEEAPLVPHPPDRASTSRARLSPRMERTTPRRG